MRGRTKKQLTLLMNTVFDTLSVVRKGGREELQTNPEPFLLFAFFLQCYRKINSKTIFLGGRGAALLLAGFL